MRQIRPAEYSDIWTGKQRHSGLGPAGKRRQRLFEVYSRKLEPAQMKQAAAQQEAPLGVGGVQTLLRQFSGFFQLPAHGMEQPGSAQHGQDMLLFTEPAGQDERAAVGFADFRHAVSASRDERGAERHQQLEFALVAPGRFGEVLAKHQGAPHQGCDFRIGVSLPRYGRGAQVVANGQLRHARRLVVSGQPPADALQFRRVKLFECASHAPVQEPPTYRAQVRVRHFPQKVVSVIVGACALPVDDAALPQFLQGARQAVLVPIGGLG